VTNAAVINALKSEFKKADWWDETQPDVRTRLEWVIDHLDQIGVFFCRTFMCLFQWEFERRKIEGETVKNPMAGYLTTILGMRIPEESYQCGVLPTRSILNLYDYIEPNDSDVAACMFLCNKIESLIRVGLLVEKEQKLTTTPEEIAEAFRRVAHKNRSRQGPPKSPEIKPTKGEVIKWDYDPEDESASETSENS